MLSTERTRIAAVRRAFPTLDEMTYLNVATHGLTPRPVLAGHASCGGTA